MLFLATSTATTPIYLAVILLIIGLVCIIKGGDFFVDASVWVAEVLHMPKFLIGATIVSLATTLPELIVSIIAVAEGNYAISVGNAVGSVTANTGLILALSAIFVSGTVERKEFGIKGFLIMLSGLILFAFCLTGKFGIIPSVLLIIVLVYYMYQTVKDAASATQNNDDKEENAAKDGKTITMNVIKFIAGVTGIILGAQLLVDNATIVAKAVGVSDAIIAITIVAIGTSLPELITTVTSIVKKQGELGVGNVIGANIIDLVLILPICSFISGGNLLVVDQSRFLDLPILLIESAIAVIPTLIQKKFKRWQGFALLAIYVTYIILAATLF